MLGVATLLLSTCTPQAEPLVVEERVILELPPDLPGQPRAFAIATGGARAVGVLSMESGDSVLYQHGPDPEVVAISPPHRFLSTPRFSADGAQLAWVWGDPKGKDREEWEIWLDGKLLKKWDWIGAFTFSSQGELAYQAADGLKLDANGWYRGGDYYVVRGKKKSAKYSDFGPTRPWWSPDGKRLAFHGAKSNGSHVIVDGKEFGPYSWVQGFCWLDDKTAAWSALDSSGKARIIVGKRELGEERESVGAPAAGGGALAYLYASRNRRGLIFRDEVVPGLYDDLGTPAVSPDGAHVVVAAAKHRQAIEAGWIMVDPSWMDGAITWEESESERTPEPEGAAAAGQTPAGPLCFLLLDGKPLGAEWMRAVQPFFSPDGKRVAARVRSKEGWHLQLDARATAAYDEVADPRFAADGTLEFGARRGRSILLVRVPVAAD